MAHPLDGCRAKLARAHETIQTLKQEIAIFEQPSAPPFRVARENVGNEFVFRVYGNPELPLRFSVLAGEVIHHLRSSLDYVVHALVLANKQDLPNSMNVTEVVERYELNSITGRDWYIQATCACSGDGIPEAVNWIEYALRKKSSMPMAAKYGVNQARPLSILKEE